MDGLVGDDWRYCLTCNSHEVEETGKEAHNRILDHLLNHTLPPRLIQFPFCKLHDPTDILASRLLGKFLLFQRSAGLCCFKDYLFNRTAELWQERVVHPLTAR